MALSTRLDLRQTQTLVMTPQLQQAIKLLQMSSVELSDFVETELEQNPLLERDDPDGGAANDSSSDDVETDGFEDADTGGDAMDLTMSETLPSDGEQPLDTEFENVWDEGEVQGSSADIENSAFAESYSGTGGRSDFQESTEGFEATLSGELTLRDKLHAQINMDIASPADRMIGLMLVDQLDDSGWLSFEISTVAVALGCELQRVEAVLEQLQRFEPPGIFARDLRECLALQLNDRDRLTPAMVALLDNLELVGRGDATKLTKICGIDGDESSDLVSEIRTLNPKPGEADNTIVAQAVAPDVLMRRHPDGSWIIELNPTTLPRVLVNSQYYQKVSREVRKREEKDYIAERFQTANWLVKSLHQRATTILKVASEIVRQQDAFFTSGVEHLRPLILRDIAEEIEMHESTVSRVTSNKYIATPRGTFELKYFFTSSIASALGGDSYSAEAVRFRIKKLIDDELSEAVLSDDKLVELLRIDGIDIARRTVAKYREAMNIASSVQRRRERMREF